MRNQIFRDRVLGEAEKDSFIALPGTEGKTGSCPQNHVSQLRKDREKFCSNFSKRAWSARGHSSDGLVVREVGVSIISLQVQLVWGLHACGQLTISNFSHLEGVSVFAKQLKDTIVSADGEIGPCPKAALDSFSQVSRPLPSLIYNCMHLPDPRVGKIPWRRKCQPTHILACRIPMDRGAWWAIVHGITKSWTWPSD